MTAGGQAIWHRIDAALPVATPVCPCCQRPVPVEGEVFDLAVDVALQVFDVTRPMIMGRSRTRPVARARALIVWALRRLRPDMSYKAIGLKLGGLHHSSVVHLHQVAIAERLRNGQFADACRKLATLANQMEGNHAVN